MREGNLKVVLTRPTTSRATGNNSPSTPQPIGDLIVALFDRQWTRIMSCLAQPTRSNRLTPKRSLSLKLSKSTYQVQKGAGKGRRVGKQQHSEILLSWWKQLSTPRMPYSGTTDNLQQPLNGFSLCIFLSTGDGLEIPNGEFFLWGQVK